MAKREKENKEKMQQDGHDAAAEPKNERTVETEEPVDAEAAQEAGKAAGEQREESPAGSGANTCEERYAELNNKYIRLYSDFDNFRKRTIKEKADTITMASAEVIKDLLVILDDFERAIANNEKVEDPSTLREGFRLIQHKLMLALQNKGLEPTDAKGEVFDADKHEAITNVAVTDDAQKGKVIDVIERGYNLRGKTLRYAKVIVGQ